MNVKYFLCICVAAVLVAHAVAAEVEAEHVEESTESPIADLAMIDADISSSTERPPVAVKKSEPMKSEEKPATQRHTVADFIIHPLIAFKPRVAEEDVPAGKQATATSTTPSPWQLFGFNTGQGLGSQVSNSVSSLAGSVTGWINDRIQLPGLVDTPVRDSTTTTTTVRPDIVVRVQHNRQSTRRPVIRINQNQNNRPNNFNNNRPNRRNRPNRFNSNNNNNFNNNNNLGFDSQEDEYDDQEEYDDEFHYNNNNNNRDEDEHDDDDSNKDSAEESDDHANDQSGEEEEDESDEVAQKPANNKRRPVQVNQQRKRPQNTRTQPKRRLTATQQYGFIDEDSSEHDDSDDDNNNNNNNDEVDDDDAEDVEHYYYEEVRPSTKRSQTQANFIQRGQQSLINQIRQLTQGLSPADVAATSQRRPQQITKRQRQQAAVLINRNGQTFYVAPELLSSAIPLTNNAQQYQYFSQGGVKKVAKKPNKLSGYPQPPLTVPLKRKGRPTQYITIPWTQLGIAPPNELVSIAEGVQSKPLILNIPQNAINAMQSSNRRKHRPAVSGDAVPLLADASLMDIFKPPRIPPSRTTTVNKGTPVYIASKGGIRPATIVEKAPAMAESMENPNESDDTAVHSMQSGATSTNTNERQTTEGEYIIVGEDNEPGLTRHVQPVYGDARYVQINGRKPIYELLNRGRFALRKSGRSLEQPESVDTVSLEQQKAINREQQIPVQIINEAEEPQTPISLQTEPIAPQPTQASPVVDAAPVIVEAIPAPLLEQEAVIQEAPVPVVEAKENA